MRLFSKLLTIGALLTAVMLVIVACDGEDPTPTPTPRPTPTRAFQTPSAVPTATRPPSGTVAPKPTYAAAPRMTIDQNKRYFATIKTNRGDMRLELLPKIAPVTVNNFVFLSRQGFYDGVRFHRIIKDFMIQGGDPFSADDAKIAAWGTGGPGYTIPDEFPCPNGTVTNSQPANCTPTVTFTKSGYLAMANTGRPATGGSQFFITLVPTPHLNGLHTIFGQIVGGADILQALGLVATVPGDRPAQPVTIQTIVIEEQ